MIKKLSRFVEETVEIVLFNLHPQKKRERIQKNKAPPTNKLISFTEKTLVLSVKQIIERERDRRIVWKNAQNR